jgi:hypothetical protein
MVSKDRESWRIILREAEANIGCSADDDDDDDDV